MKLIVLSLVAALASAEVAQSSKYNVLATASMNETEAPAPAPAPYIPPTGPQLFGCFGAISVNNLVIDPANLPEYLSISPADMAFCPALCAMGDYSSGALNPGVVTVASCNAQSTDGCVGDEGDCHCSRALYSRPEMDPNNSALQYFKGCKVGTDPVTNRPKCVEPEVNEHKCFFYIPNTGSVFAETIEAKEF